MPLKDQQANKSTTEHGHESGVGLIVIFLLLVLVLGIAGFVYFRTSETAQIKKYEEIQKLEQAEELKNPSFVRFVRISKDEGRLETATMKYERDGVTLDLVGAVHIADSAYYKELDSQFKTYDSLLYEMVKPKESKPRKENPGDSWLSMLQRAMKTVLDLEFQLDGIDYTSPNFVHADLDAESFGRLMHERNESMLGTMIRLSLEGFKMQLKGKGSAASNIGLPQILAVMAEPEKAYALKYVFAQQMEQVEELMAGLEAGSGPEGSVLIVERNKAAMRVLSERLVAGDKKLGIFYGAAHLKDFHDRILELGFTPKKLTWQTAWDVHPPILRAEQ